MPIEAIKKHDISRVASIILVSDRFIIIDGAIKIKNIAEDAKS
jgi:hypothetical protein